MSREKQYNGHSKADDDNDPLASEFYRQIEQLEVELRIRALVDKVKDWIAKLEEMDLTTVKGARALVDKASGWIAELEETGNYSSFLKNDEEAIKLLTGLERNLAELHSIAIIEEINRTHFKI